MKNPILEDALQLHLENPDTFDFPSPFQFSRIEVGDFVKVCSCGERFWCRVVEHSGSELFCVIDNDLVLSDHGLKFGDTLIVKLKNVYQISKA